MTSESYRPGLGTIRRYGFGAFQPCGYVFFASSSETEPAMTTSSPAFQLAGVATLCFAHREEDAEDQGDLPEERATALRITAQAGERTIEVGQGEGLYGRR